MTLLQKDVLKEIRPFIRNRRLLLAPGIVTAYFVMQYLYRIYVTKDPIIKILNGAVSTLTTITVLILFVITISHLITLQSIKRMTDAELYQLSGELTEGIPFKSSHVLVTESFVVGRNIGLVLLPVDEILLVYDRLFSIQNIPIYASTVLLTASNQTFSVGGRFFPLIRDGLEREELFFAIQGRTSNLMGGATNENMRIYKDMVKQWKEQGKATKR